MDNKVLVEAMRTFLKAVGFDGPLEQVYSVSSSPTSVTIFSRISGSPSETTVTTIVTEAPKYVMI